MKLNKFIAQSGLCSLREAERLIHDGKVKVNGKSCVRNIELKADEIVEVEGRTIKISSAKIYLAFNKPVGIVCTEEKDEKNNIISFINYPERLFTIGRLDKDSEGLILLTNDGAISNRISNAENGHEKEYLVTLDKPLTNRFKIAQLEAGVKISGTITKPCKIRTVNATTFKFILTQGLNRQIRKMTESIGYKVIKLKRVRLLNIELGDLETGKWRELSYEELSGLHAILDKA
ncbi:MAG: pseudouridine synthase [Bacteroidia bacterium]